MRSVWGTAFSDATYTSFLWMSVHILLSQYSIQLRSLTIQGYGSVCCELSDVKMRVSQLAFCAVQES